MNKIFSLFLVMAASAILSSCSNEVKHEKALRSYVTLRANVNAARSTFRSYCNLVAEISKQGTTDADTLILALKHSEHELLSILDTVKCIGLTEGSSELKDSSCEYVQRMVEIQQKTLPALISGIMEKDSASAHISSVEDLKKLDVHFLCAARDYAATHELSDAELSIYRLN